MATYRLSSPASMDLDQIWHHHATRANAEIARRQVASLTERFQLLSEHPFLGVVRNEYAPEMRSHAVPRTQYVIFYYPTEYGVRIARVAHGRRDTQSMFESPSND